MTTGTIAVISAAAVVVVYALWVGIPLWMVHKRPDTAPDNELPEYLRLRHEYQRERELAGSCR
ncbi:MAG: hypothetical protein ABSA93_10170 [Streptosporangiaceae bacterium]|jgi:hypothetical protein